MVDAVADLTNSTDAALAVIGALLAEVQKDVALLSAMPKDNTPAIEQQVERLKTGTAAAAAALAAFQSPPLPLVAEAAQPAPEAPAAEVAPAAEPAPAAPAAPAEAPPAA